ncbi:hypothetical protein [uncultured Roseibium sp.]|uniref:hypothetical protein n=1 Tax=uncultured Roseibium sp. TaxID=1936171 RepID=UPI002628EAAC|nr:hypothetical protein [uncultured Roseibium sp.]
MSCYKSARIMILSAIALGAVVSASAAQETRDERRARNCGYYREMVRHALESVDGKALTPGFVEEHDAFIDGGCLATRPACPRSPADFAFADMLLMMTVSANMGSTFSPFWCPVKNQG